MFTMRERVASKRRRDAEGMADAVFHTGWFGLFGGGQLGCLCRNKARACELQQLVSYLQHDNDPKQSSKTLAALLTPLQTSVCGGVSRAAEDKDEEVIKAIKPVRGKLWLTCNQITPQSLQHCDRLIEDHHF